MKKKVLLVSLTALILSLSLSACMLTGTPINVSGTWHVKAIYTAPDGSSTTVLEDDMEFQQNGTSLTVDYVFHGTVSGNQVTFSFSYQGSTMSFSGTVNGNKMSGTWTVSDGTSTFGGTWTATKK